ncbi:MULTISPECIES: cyd operon protein YbgE [Pantoea]|uniref:cyd operon protein YbgE n=1 Tax=Pantoea TaxID=53335 RepID=UPI000A22362F|nr:MULTISPECIES: cyd operon protein YbgE [Pantoea]MBW1253636.1 cyd operon protein YbgE [Pantoea allii]MBW1260834.1 cyd operon protein YbgE [Pantoea allii]MBW1284876.1 cyd operon protein YbgE [Pantoea allii]MDJ0087852.1 cyd operon protein YbgE [Pantoea allii]NQS86728.1 cyd operon protein YbgE [Pantoea allii]
MGRLIQTAYRLMDKGPFRALSLILALWLAGCLLWNPARFASGSGGILLWQGMLLIWAVCTGVIHGTGFQPRRLRWRAFFTPLPALVVLLWGVSRFYL